MATACIKCRGPVYAGATQCGYCGQRVQNHDWPHSEEIAVMTTYTTPEGDKHLDNQDSWDKFDADRARRGPTAALGAAAAKLHAETVSQGIMAGSEAKVPTNANERQVGGAHYAGNMQHWDYVVAQGLGYFEGQITKYVTRWRKKNGLEDLRKARHFLDKLIEEVTAGRINP